MSIPLRTLIIEDSEDDTLLLVRILQKGGYDPAYKRVETADAMDEALERAVWDIIMCDYSMPHFNGHEALALFKKKELEIPFIVVSGTIGEEAAVAIMISGAHDYVMKTNLSRLVPAVQRELKETESRRKRKLAEEALKISEQKYRNIFENVVEGIFQTTPEGRFLIANSVQASILGYGSPEELIETVTDMGKQIYVNPDDREEYLRIIQESGLVKDFEVQLKKKDSSIIWASLNARSVFDENNKLLCCEGTIEDITSRKEAEIALQKSRDELAVIIEGSAIPQFVINQDHVVILWNKALEIYSGMDAKDVSGTSDHWKAFYPVKRPCLVDLVIDGANGDEFTRWYGTRYKKSIFIDGAYEATGYFTCMKGGIWLFFTAVTINDSSGNMIAAIETLEDITGLKTAETSMRQSEEKYRSIFENAIEGIFQATPEGRFISVNPAMAYMHGFASPEEMIMGVADIGQQLYVNPEDRARYRAILEEKELVNNFEAQIYRTDGNILWTSTNTRVVKDEAGHITCFEGTSEDITSRKLAEENLKETAEKLRKTLIGVIQAMSLTVETRDPYTAGHQRRVSSLARVIAQEMVLPNDTVDTIRTAGILHDIGKIAVPSEILSKPTKLTDIEFSLIKVHSQSGYDILKDVGFPSPLAEAVLQHHERLDGSGYPQGLKNGQILLEAKILAVADVVEAIASHRPYRPAKGIDAALEEIEKNKDILYDAGAVKTCVRLFKEKGFSFE